MSDATMLTDEQRDKLAEGWCVVAWRDADGEHWEHGDDAEVWHRAQTLPPGVPVWVNGYAVTR
jgi:hypothetical protein